MIATFVLAPITLYVYPSYVIKAVNFKKSLSSVYVCM
jgi:hypothetical protein